MEIKCEKCGEKTIPCSCVAEYRRQQEKERIDMHIHEIESGKFNSNWQGVDLGN